MGNNSGFREVHGKLGFFGWFWRILFFAWHAITVLIVMVLIFGPIKSDGSGAVDAVMIGLILILIGWAAGSVVLGLPVFLTRRPTVLIPPERQTTARQTTARQTTVGQTTVGQTTVGQATVGQATVEQTTVGQTTLGQATVGRPEDPATRRLRRWEL